MAKFDYAVTDANRSGRVATLFKAVTLSMLATVVALSLLALLIVFGPLGEEIIQSCVPVAVIASVFFAALSVSVKGRSKGWLYGVLTAAVYLAVMLTAGYLIFGSVSFGTQTLKIFGMCAVSGCIGGIVGVNIKHKEKRK